MRGTAKFQSPSLRGSGRFDPASDSDPGPGPGFNPLHCGAVVASGCCPRATRQHHDVSIPFIAGQWSLLIAPRRMAEGQGVSIPFIAGQWSLQAAVWRAWRAEEQVSIPFIAGQWSLQVGACMGVSNIPHVSIPFIAGQWSLLPVLPPRAARVLVSIPFIAGQWSLHAWTLVEVADASGFNPLHCGAVVASFWERLLL